MVSLLKITTFANPNIVWRIFCILKQVSQVKWFCVTSYDLISWLVYGYIFCLKEFPNKEKQKPEMILHNKKKEWRPLIWNMYCPFFWFCKYLQSLIVISKSVTTWDQTSSATQSKAIEKKTVRVFEHLKGNYNHQCHTYTNVHCKLIKI